MITSVKKRIQTKKARRLHKRKLQTGGVGQISNPTLIKNILAKLNASPQLIASINTELNLLDKTKITVDTLKNKYNGSRLFDLIYANKTLTKYEPSIIPTLIWEHGFNNPDSITAGMVGTHIYIYNDDATKTFKLLGVIFSNKVNPLKHDKASTSYLNKLLNKVAITNTVFGL